MSSSLTTSALNLSKNIIGAGMLSLPFAMKGAGVVPSLAGIAVYGAVNAYTFFLLGLCCDRTKAKSFGELWAKTFGQSSAWIVDLSIVANNGMACLAYCVLVGDFVSKALAGLLPSMTILHSRSVVLALVATCFLLPLSLLKDLAPLRFSSLAGLAATAYGFCLLVFDCSTKADVTSPASAVVRNMFPIRVDFFAALAMFSSAFMAHYNSPKFYADLQDTSPKRFAQLVGLAYGLAFVAFFIFGFCGFALFGFSAQGNVLKNYGAEPKVLLAWLGMAFSVTFTYPLVFSTFRDAAVGLLGHCGHKVDGTSSGFRVPFTVCGVALTAFGGSIFNNVAVVNGVKGAVLSACLAFIYPALIHLRLSSGDEYSGHYGALSGGPTSAGKSSSWAGSSNAMRMFSKFLIVLGASSGVLALLAMFVLPQTDFSELEGGQSEL